MNLCKKDCETCGGHGYVGRERDIDDPDYGKLTPCPERPPESLFDFEARGIYKNEIHELTWEALKKTPNVKTLQNAVDGLIERGHGWLYIWGAPGLTKTVALKIAVYNSLMERRPAFYTRMADILENLRAAYDDDDSAEKRLASWRSVPILAIDEFDRARDTEFAQEKRFALMDDRYTSALRGETITIMAANKDPQEFDSYLADRIFDGRFQVLHLEGASLRPAMEAA